MSSRVCRTGGATLACPVPQQWHMRGGVYAPFVDVAAYADSSLCIVLAAPAPACTHFNEVETGAR
jgi:hypothetical protein